MYSFFPKHFVIGGVVVLVVSGILAILLLPRTAETPPVQRETTPEVAQEEKRESPVRTVLGTSVEGREIEAYTFGTGETHLLFVGGIHGGYEWNSVLLAYQAIDYLTDNPQAVPVTLSVTVIPSLNPDDLFNVIRKEGRFVFTDVPKTDGPVGLGRFNANDVDLNRNFDCKWKPESMWRGAKVNAGTAPFSEPETQALKKFIEASQPEAVVFWHSQASAVYASECEKGILPETLTLMDTYAKASKYTAVKSFDAYPVTGDAEGWLASINIPAITVELQTHETIEWERNLKGIQALLVHYGEKGAVQ